MAGVIDSNGQQWEMCNNCGKFVKIEELRYEQPSENHDCGRDLCASCAPEMPPAQPIIISFPEV